MKHDLVKEVQQEQDAPFGNLMASVVSVHLRLENFSHAQDIFDCLNNKKVFGLSDIKNSMIVFDPENLRIYDYTNKKLTFVQSRSHVDFLNYVKLSVINHRVFMEGQKCMDYFESNNLLA